MLLMIAAILAVAVLGLAFWNGANDVSKGVATLAGSGVTRIRTAIVWGALWTATGGVVAAFAASGLARAFSGSGLISAMPDGHSLLLSVAAGALLWVALATRTGLPVSTTHAITGALLGAGVSAAGWTGIAWHVLLTKFAAPLVLSPFVALAIVFLLIPVIRVTFQGLQQHCVCLEREVALPVTSGNAAAYAHGTAVVTGTTAECESSLATVARLNLMDGLHWLTAGATSFARGLNDAPKILGLGVAANASLGIPHAGGFLLVASAMLLGSLVAGLRVTKTLAERVTTMTPSEGFAANLVTSALVILASRFALPVSTTHVSSGAIIGLGLKRGTRGIHWKTVRDMLGAWAITLPVSALLAALVYGLLLSVQ